MLLGPALLAGCAFGWFVDHDPRAGLGSRRLALVVLGASCCVLGVLTLLASAHSDLLDFDRSVAPWGREHTAAFASWMVNRVTTLGSTATIVVATTAVLTVETIRRPSRWMVCFLLAVTIGQTLLSDGIKALVDRARPMVNPIAHTLGPAFPSGHTTAAAACFAAYALVLGRGRTRRTESVLAGGAVFVAVAVAASRVLLGVHWVSDVLAGLALGWGWFAACSLLFGRPMRTTDAAARVVATDEVDDDPPRE